MSLLGKEATEKVTGFSGVITSVSFDLYGCIQVVITPKVDREGKCPDGHWFDVSRIKLGKDSGMPKPNFNRNYADKKGPAEKPIK